MKGRAAPGKKLAVQEKQSPTRKPKVRGKALAEEKDQKFLGDGEAEAEAKRRSRMTIAKKPSYVLRESICAEEEEAHSQEVESWIGRKGAGTTVWQHRFDHTVVDYRKDASKYHTMPTIVDFPIQAINPMNHKANTQMHIDILSFKMSLGKVIVELFEKEAPRTCANFRSLCLGDNDKKLTYMGCRFHKVIPGFMMMTGDITKGDGSGGEAIYDGDFPDESFQLRHVGAGILTMINRGTADSNNSQFAILLDKAEWLDGRHVVFGKVVDGLDMLKKVADKFGSESGIPNSDIYIGESSIE